MATPTIDAIPFGAGFDEEIVQAWRQVQERVIQMAGGDRSKIQHGLGIDTVLRYLDEAQAKESKDSEKYAAVKSIFSRTLQCIQTVGGIVADGASYVFQPANTCYNALTFVIQAWQGYEGIFESLATLLEKCIEFLDRLSYYAASGMDPKLTRVACQHLQFFVEICDRSLRLKSKRSKLKAFMKQLFLNDDGVQDALSCMERLVDKERGLVAAQTWKSSNEAAANSRDGLILTRKLHNNLVDDKTQLKREKELQAWKNVVVDSLDLDRYILDPETPPPWETAWKKRKSAVLQGTGEWLMAEHWFERWISCSSTSTRILGIQGDVGRGKTMLATNVVLWLRKMTTEKTGSRVVVAHHFCENGPKASAAETDPLAITQKLLCQLALGDESFLKSVAGICEKSRYFDGFMDIWERLLLDNEDRKNLDASFFIILDGLGDNIKSFIPLFEQLTSNPFLDRVRILITGDSEMFRDIDRGSIDLNTVGLYVANRNDVELYINHRMDQMETLSDCRRDGVSEMRSNVIEKLHIFTDDDFYKIDYVLDDIAKMEEVDEINERLDAAGTPRLDQLEAEIKKLNEARAPKEIAEINEIILWMMKGPQKLSVEVMEAALSLRSNPDAAGNHISLMSLASKIKTKYTLFTIKDDTIRYRIDGSELHIPDKKRNPDDQGSFEPSLIQPVEVNIIRHYLSTVCPKDLYDKFGFDKFFEEKMVRKGSYICFDGDNVHITLALRCLTCLIEPRSGNRDLVLGYAREDLFFHLNHTDLALADRDLKAEVGVMLVRLFTEDYAVNSWFSLRCFGNFTSPTYLYSLNSWRLCLFSSEAVDVMKIWFKDSAVIERVRDHPLVQELNDPESDPFQVLLGFTAASLAKDIFRGQVTPYLYLQGFLFILGAIQRDADLYGVTPEMVEHVESWCQKTLGVVEKDAYWEARAAAVLLQLFERNCQEIPKSAIEERARKALALDPNQHEASHILSQTTESTEEAIDILEADIAPLMCDQAWQQDRHNKNLLVKMIIRLGDAYWKEHMNEKAIATYAKVLEVSQETEIVEDLIFEVFQGYEEDEEWDAMMGIVEQLVEKTPEALEPREMFLYRVTSYSWPSNKANLSRAARETGKFDLCVKMYEKAIAICTDPEELHEVEYQYGNFLAEFPGHETEAIAAWESALERLPKDGRDYYNTKIGYLIIQKYQALIAQRGNNTGLPKVQVYHAQARKWCDFLYDVSGRDTESRRLIAKYFLSTDDELRAKDIVRDFVITALEMLSDDIAHNDWFAFDDLLFVFCVFDDMENVGVVMELKTWNRRANSAEYDLDFPEEVDESVSWRPSMAITTCHGECGREFQVASEFWMCVTENGQVIFCPDCRQKLENKTDPGIWCDPDHFLFYFGKRDDERLDAVPEGSVLLRDRLMTFEEWKAEIRAKYIDYRAAEDGDHD